MQFGMKAMRVPHDMLAALTNCSMRAARAAFDARLAFVVPAVLAGLCGFCAVALWQPAREAAQVLRQADDAAMVSEHAARQSVAREDAAQLVAARIDAALQEADADLAQSFVAFADEYAISLPNDLRARVTDAIAAQAAPAAVAQRFAKGFVTGTIEDGASLAGTLAGDLFVFGDIRDAVREGAHLARGEEADKLILALAGAGMAVSAGTYFSLGGALPFRAGLTALKDARKAGRLSASLTDNLMRAARAEKAAVFVRAIKDTSRVAVAAGPRAARDALKLAEAPADLSKAARMAEKQGGKTRAVLKLAGRGALVLGSAAFNLAGILFSLLMSLIGFAASIKTMTERLTQRYLDRAKRRRAALSIAPAHG